MYAADRCNTASLRLVLSPARVASSASAPGALWGWGCEGADDCGLLVAVEGLGTKDRCGLSNPEPERMLRGQQLHSRAK